jgi:hypothetical protein
MPTICSLRSRRVLTLGSGIRTAPPSGQWVAPAIALTLRVPSFTGMAAGFVNGDLHVWASARRPPSLPARHRLRAVRLPSLVTGPVVAPPCPAPGPVKRAGPSARRRASAARRAAGTKPLPAITERARLPSLGDDKAPRVAYRLLARRLLGTHNQVTGESARARLGADRGPPPLASLSVMGRGP